MTQASVLFVAKGSLDHIPPLFTHLLRISQEGCSVTAVVGACSSHLQQQLADHGVLVQVVSDNSKGPARKILDWAAFRASVAAVFRRETWDAVWIASGDTALATAGLFGSCPTALMLLELYDSVPLYRRTLGVLARRSEVVLTVEPTRAAIMKSWWGLTRAPLVIPNSPLNHPRAPEVMRRTPSGDRAVALMTRRTILYQGLIDKRERDASTVAQAVDDLGGDFQLMLLGRDLHGDAATLVARHRQVVHVDALAWPTHLQVTAQAWLGLASYRGWNLNTLFCAPNKIYEYAGFGIPMLCDRVPGLLSTVDKFEAGICVDMDSPDEIAAAILSLEQRYDQYSARATKMFEETDTRAPISEAIELLLS